MRVRLIASTLLLDSLAELSAEEGVEEADQLAEFAGRACYQSWNRPNPATATNQTYLANIIASQHFSVLEHASATFYITGVSRSLTHELVRHRHLSFSQLSQRFVDESTSDVVMPRAVVQSPSSEALQDQIRWLHSLILVVYKNLTQTLTGEGLSTKKTREAARAVLPSCTETKIVVSGNLRAWREFIIRRNTDAADQEIHELAAIVLTKLKLIAPNSFQDLE